MDIDYCLEKGFLVKIDIDEELVNKELREASYDLDKAGKALDDEDFKWAIIKAYYSMFHAARAVLFRLGLNEKKHFAVGVVLEDLNKKGKLESKFVNYFNAAVSSREDADYHYIYSKEIALYNVKIAEEFLTGMKKLLKKI